MRVLFSVTNHLSAPNHVHLCQIPSKRSLLVTLQPPFTETDLQQEEHKPDYQTKRIATVRSEIQSEREINDSTGNRLSDIIAQTHFSIKAKIGYKLLEAFLLIKQHKRRNQNQRKGQLLPHVKNRPYGLLRDCIIFHNQIFQRIQGSKRNSRNDKCLCPQAQVAFRRKKQLLAPHVETKQEKTGRLEEASGVDSP